MNATTSIGFLLIPGFSLLAYASAIEPLRAANVLSGRTLYRWHHLSPDGQPSQASNGLSVTPDLALGQAAQLACLIVCAGGNPALFRDAATLRRLRRLAQQRLRLGAIAGGAYILARAGVLNGYRFTLHWEHIPALHEEFPELDVRQSLFEFDRDRLTSSGGTAPLDMMHALIAREHGIDLAVAVSEWLMQTQIRRGDTANRMPPADRFGTSNPVVLKVLAAMEDSVETPSSRAQLAEVAGISTRQLDRLFRCHLGRSVGHQYLRMRLDRARMLVRQTVLSQLEVAVASGFTGAPHFSRAYRSAFGTSPSADRRAAQPPPRRL